MPVGGQARFWYTLPRKSHSPSLPVPPLPGSQGSPILLHTFNLISSSQPFPNLQHVKSLATSREKEDAHCSTPHDLQHLALKMSATHTIAGLSV